MTINIRIIFIAHEIVIGLFLKHVVMSVQIEIEILV